MMMKHKWHKEIKAWADGAEIESNYIDGAEEVWVSEERPHWWKNDFEFRIKPQPKETQYLYVYQNTKSEFIALSLIERKDKEYNLISKIKLENEND
jgi:hypothetical protein